MYRTKLGFCAADILTHARRVHRILPFHWCDATGVYILEIVTFVMTDTLHNNYFSIFFVVYLYVYHNRLQVALNVWEHRSNHAAWTARLRCDRFDTVRILQMDNAQSRLLR